MKMERSFAVGEIAEVEVNIPAGDIALRSGEPHKVDVVVSGSERALESLEIDEAGGAIVVFSRGANRRFVSRGVDVTISMPPGGVASLKTSAGDVDVRVPLERLTVKLAAGDVRAGDVAGLAEVKSASGDVSIDRAGEVRVSTASGDIKIGVVDGDVTAHTASGDVAVGVFGREADLKSASGDLSIDRVDGSDVRAKTMAGSVILGLPSGLEVEADITSMTGSIRSELTPSGLPGGRAVRLQVKTLSGNVVLRPAGR